MSTTQWKLCSILARLLLCAVAATAQTPLGPAFTYQGALRESGQPFNGNTNFVFRLFDAPTGGTTLGSQSLPATAVIEGLFTVQLNGGGEFGPNAFDGNERWLEIEVNGAPLTPRQRITAVPYAQRAVAVQGIDGHSLDAADGSPIDALYVDTLGRVGIGTTIPLSPLTLRSNGAGNGLVHSDGFSAVATYLAGGGVGSGGWIGTTTPDPLHFFTNNSSPRMSIDTIGRVGIGTTTPGMSLEVTTPSYYGFPAIGGSTGSAYAYLHISPTDHALIWNQGHGMRFGTETSRGLGFVEHMRIGSNGNVGIGGDTAVSTRLRVIAPDTPDQTGVFSSTLGANGVAVWASAPGTNGIGVRGSATGTNGVAVWGSAPTIGVFGSDGAQPDLSTSAGVQGRGINGVFGEGLGSGSVGVLGHAFSIGGGIGVEGNGGYAGVKGISGQNGIAVLGDGSLAEFGVYSFGNMGASGTKPFRIDHPDDPTNKYLLHYAAESPEVINFYRGAAVLDDAGEAVVELPRYFAKINKSPSYQLTALGAPMPMLHVGVEIDEDALRAGATAEPGQPIPVCSFRISGGAPGRKVSWRVEALRNDRWVRSRGAPIEVEKPESQRGTYQHPELYGQPSEKGMNADTTRNCVERPSQPPAMLPATAPN